MTLTETAERNHRRLFPDHVSRLKVTDPEFIEAFDNFAFDEVLSHGRLDEPTRLRVILAALIASQSLAEFKVMARAALGAGVTPVDLKEIVYQAVPYCGLAIVYDFLQASNEVLASLGIELPLPGQATHSSATRLERGLAVQKAIFGDAIEAMHAQMPTDQAHIHRFLAANCFGDHLTRAGLDVPQRELLTFSMLLAMRGCEAQLKGHILGNARVGNGRAVLIAVVTQLLPYLGYPRALNALRCLDEILPAAPGDSE